MLLQDTDSAFKSYLGIYIGILVFVVVVFAVTLVVRLVVSRRLKAKEEAYELAALSDRRLRFVRHDLENYSRAYEAGDMDMDHFVEYIVADKVLRAQEKDIYLVANVSPLGVKMEVRRATALLSNLLDNAIEACENAAKAGCEEPVIHADISEKLIHIKNSKPQDVHPIERNFETSKEDAGSHGMGIKIIRMVTDRLGGKLEMKDNGDTFETWISWRDE
ncbi:MAG: GHKL domain-containing protein [Lachnospiraceae bacterium]|nr:GHKL domain-containing protein [Lachnospiraceae bacterium]